MLKIQLDSEGENRRGILQTYYSPFIRKTLFLFISIALLGVNWSIFSLDANLSTKIIRSSIASPCTAFVIWFFFSFRYVTTLGSFQQTTHVLSGQTKEFSYTPMSEGVLEKTESYERCYPYSQYLGYKKSGVETWLIFQRGIIYLPRYAVTSGAVNTFIDQVNKHISTQLK